MLAATGDGGTCYSPEREGKGFFLENSYPQETVDGERDPLSLMDDPGH